MRRRASRTFARWPAYRRVPSFTPGPVRARRDGWTPERQARFLGWLAQTGCVAKAAAKLGMARETAYRLRRRAGADSFAHAWDAIMTIRSGGETPPRKVTLDERWVLAMEGGFVVRMRHGTLPSEIPACPKGQFILSQPKGGNDGGTPIPFPSSRRISTPSGSALPCGFFHPGGKCPSPG